MSSSVSVPKVNKMAAKKTESVVAPASTPAPAPAKASAKAASAKAQSPAAVAASAEVTVPVVSEVRTADAILTSLQETLRSLQSDMTARVRSAVHDAQEALRAMKREVRDNKRRRKVDPATLSPEARVAWEARRANNAFLKVRPITDELCTFMGLPAKSKRSQTDVTKFISGYIKAHNCFDPSFKRRILPDAKLGKLLRVTDKNEVSYLNLQTYLKVHFIKPAV
jgi:chromatin remodeling complex protein RSC6